MSELLYLSYSKFASVTAGNIERRRLRHRLLVVQTLEETMKKSIIRSVGDQSKLPEDDMQVSNSFL